MSTKPMASSRKTMHTARTSSDDDDDPTSSSGSSSSESEDEADDSEEEDELMDRTTSTAATAAGATTSSTSIPSIPGRPKPRIHRMEGGSELLSRLSAFLPKMKDANEDLEREITAGRAKDMVLDDVNDEDGKDYIEMVCLPLKARFRRGWLSMRIILTASRTWVWACWKKSEVKMRAPAVEMRVMVTTLVLELSLRETRRRQTRTFWIH